MELTKDKSGQPREIPSRDLKTTLYLELSGLSDIFHAYICSNFYFWSQTASNLSAGSADIWQLSGLVT